MSKIIKVVRQTEDGLMELTTPIVVGVERPLNDEADSAKFIDISFHPAMKPFLLSLKSHFTTYDARNILRLPSSYSVRIYELLKQYEKIGKRRFQLQELKEILWVIEESQVRGKKQLKDSYPLYGNFRQRVLLKAQKDLKKYTDICFDFKPLKKGRAVDAILFHIHANTPERDESKNAPAQELKVPGQQDLFLELYPLVRERVSENTMKRRIQTLPEERIRKWISYTLNQLEAGATIDNIGGYLNTIVRQDSLFDPVEDKKQQYEEKKQRFQEKEHQKQTLTDKVRKLKHQLREQEMKVIETLFTQDPALKETILHEIQSKPLSAYDKEKSPQENYEENPLFRAFLLAYMKKKYPKHFKESQATYKKKIDALEKDLQTL